MKVGFWKRVKKWEIENGKLEMGNRKWVMGNGKWETEKVLFIRPFTGLCWNELRLTTNDN
jgi:hypothetical protein